MNLRQLEYFVAIAEVGSFTGAAERLHVAQPSLSQQIKALETELGGALLERLPRGVRLTPAGNAFLSEARAAVSHAQRATRAAHSALGLESGELEVATVTSMAYGVLPPIFRAWRAQSAGTTLRLREFRHRQQLYDAVRAGVGDVAVGPEPASWRGPLVPLAWEELVLVLPSFDPLAATSQPVAIEALAERDWVLFANEHGLSELITFICARAGFTPRPSVHTEQVAAAPHLVAAGLGVTIIPANVVPADMAAEVRRIDPPVVRRIVAFTREQWSPPATAFVELLRGQPWPRRPAGAVVVE